MSPCANCGGVTDLEEQSGGTTEGRFSEEYQCVQCGAKGWIRGEASAPPQEWTRTGQVFNG
jgi:hypothetical protein